jgi:hypothetical protein
MLFKGASDTLGAVLDIAGGLLGKGQPVDESPSDVKDVNEKSDAVGDAGREIDKPQDEGAESAEKVEPEADCKLDLNIGLEVDNVLPVGMDVEIQSVTAKVARVTIGAADISFSDIPVWAPSKQKAVLRIGLKIGSSQMMMAASGLLMTRKLRMKAEIVVKGTALWGLVEQTRKVEIERALTVEELIGGIDGSVGGK